MESDANSEPATVTLTCLEWKDHFLGFVRHLWKENLLCDTQIKCLNDDTVNAHSIILASCSPLLKKFFMKCRPGLYTLKMDTTSATLWGYLLEFLYTGHLELPQSQLMPFYNLVMKLKVKQAETLCLAYIQEQLAVCSGTSSTTTALTAATTTTATSTPAAKAPAPNFAAPSRPLSAVVSPQDVKKEMLEERMDTDSGRILGKVSIAPAWTPSANPARLSTSTPESGIFSLAPEQEQAAQPEEGTGDWNGQIKLHSVRSLCPDAGPVSMDGEEEMNKTTPHDLALEHIAAVPADGYQIEVHDAKSNSSPSINAENDSMNNEQCKTNGASDTIKLKQSENTISQTKNAMSTIKTTSPKSNKLTSPRKFSHKCTNCSRSFGTKHGLALHRNKCDPTFGGKLKIKLIKNGKACKIVERRISKEKSNLYICTTCGRRFNSLVIYRIHMDTHDKQDQRTCKVCKQVFHNAKAMYSHMRIHKQAKKLTRNTSHSDASPPADDISRFPDSSDVISPDELIAPEGVEIDSPSRHILDDDDNMDTEVLHDDEVEEEEEVKDHPPLDVANNRLVDFGTWEHEPYYFDARDSPMAITPTRDGTFHEAIQQSLNTTEPPYKCYLCNKTFKKYITMETHIKVHQGISNHKCGQCGRAFAHSGALKRHLRYCMESGSRQASPASRPSPSPQATMPSLEQLDDSILDMSVASEKTPPSTPPTLTPTEVTPTNGSPSLQTYDCKKCGQVFEKSISYRLHMKHHSLAESPQKNDSPGGKASPQRKTNLQRTSSPQKKGPQCPPESHICAQCGETFLKRTALENHVCKENVDEQKQFQCMYCHEKFHQKNLLDQHIHRSHSSPKLSPSVHATGAVQSSPANHLESNSEGVDPRERSSSRTFTCTLCEIIFDKRADFREHMVNHGQNPDYICKCCGSKFFHNDVFLDHFKRAKACKQNYMDRGEFPWIQVSNLATIGSSSFVKQQTGLKTSIATLAKPNVVGMNPVVVLNGNPVKQT